MAFNRSTALGPKPVSSIRLTFISLERRNCSPSARSSTVWPSRSKASLAETSRWTAILTIVVQTPRTPDALRKNPLGIFVNAINWSKELGS